MRGSGRRPVAEGAGSANVPFGAMPGAGCLPANVVRLRAPADLDVMHHGRAMGYHQFTASRRRGWTITGAVEDAAAGRLLLGLVREGLPLAQYLPITVAQALDMQGELLAATMADDGTAEFLMVAGVPFDTDEIHCLLGVLVALLGAVQESEQ